VISWFRHLLAWQQIGLGMVVAGTVITVAAVALGGGDSNPGTGGTAFPWVAESDGGSENQPLDTDTTSNAADSGSATSSSTGAYTGGYAGTYLGSFVVLQVIRPAAEPWDPFAAFNLYIDEEGNAHADGWCQESFQGSWGSASIDYAFQCDGVMAGDGTLTCNGTSRLHWTWEVPLVSNAPQVWSLWRPVAYMSSNDESFSDIPIVLTINVVPQPDREPVLTGRASAAWDMTSEGEIGSIGGAWYGAPGTPSPLLVP
jgi:hypothetical protein